MRTHAEIDARSLRLARAVAAKIDTNPSYLEGALLKANSEWRNILEKPWDEVRAILLQEDDEGQRLRQSSPFTAVLTPQERWAIYRE